MAKYKKGLVGDIKKEKQEAAKQAELRTKYHADDNVIIKEKTNALKFVLQLCINGIRLLIQIFIILMATVGCLSILYPDVRAPLLEILMHIFEEIVGFIAV